VKSAVGQGRAVIACAYPGHIPSELATQLPQDRSFVARISNGQVTRIVPGTPEQAVLELLRN
jgi:hypothetical protein